MSYEMQSFLLLLGWANLGTVIVAGRAGFAPQVAVTVVAAAVGFGWNALLPALTIVVMAWAVVVSLLMFSRIMRIFLGR